MSAIEQIELDMRQLERNLEALRKQLCELLVARARLEAQLGVYRCVVCHDAYVDPHQGEDTCKACRRRI
jgi:hypothetical protein